MQITQRIYNFWETNPNLWFNATDDDDKYISEMFFKYLDDGYDVQTMNNKIEWTTYCILHDQLIKHFNRYYKTIFDTPKNFITNCYDKYKYFKHHNLTDFEFMFCLMPIRHTHEINHVKFVLKEAWERLSNDKTNKFIRKFLVATYERYIKCTSEDNLIKYINSDIIFNHYEILDEISPKDFSIMIDYNDDDNSILLFTCMEEFIVSNNLINESIIISISGGVDSMVCSYLLKQLTYKFTNLKISCVHINYNNRAECKHEEELLIWWCNTILNIPLYIRCIDEINRPKCMEYELRDLYESYTKDVRFNSYISLAENPFIVLGHNKDDTIENIFTNISSCSHYENLLGMTKNSNQYYKGKDICFLRPLLEQPKSEIYKYAINHNIPFLLDSTPKWSQRGKIRDIVKPALNEWNPLIFDGLIKLSSQLEEMTSLLEKLIPSEINMVYNNINDVPLEQTFWAMLLKKNKIYVSQKTLINIIDRLKHYQLYPHKLSETPKIQLCKEKILILKQQKDKLFIYL